MTTGRINQVAKNRSSCPHPALFAHDASKRDNNTQDTARRILAGGAFFSYTARMQYTKIIVPTTPETESSRRRFSVKTRYGPFRHTASTTTEISVHSKLHLRSVTEAHCIRRRPYTKPRSTALRWSKRAIPYGNARRRRHRQPTMRSHSKLGHADINTSGHAQNTHRGFGAQLESCPEGNHSILPQIRTTSQAQIDRPRVLKCCRVERPRTARKTEDADQCKKRTRSHPSPRPRGSLCQGASRQEREAHDSTDPFRPLSSLASPRHCCTPCPPSPTNINHTTNPSPDTQQTPQTRFTPSKHAHGCGRGASAQDPTTPRPPLSAPTPTQPSELSHFFVRADAADAALPHPPPSPPPPTSMLTTTRRT